VQQARRSDGRWPLQMLHADQVDFGLAEVRIVSPRIFSTILDAP
jgi:hypothetical protein